MIDNVLLIVLDDVHAQEFGIGLTPNIDALAARGTTYSNCHTNPTCDPTRASMMTGLYAHHFGIGGPVRPSTTPGVIPEQNPELPPDSFCLGDLFKAAGFRTLATGKWAITNDDLAAAQLYGFDDFLAGSMQGVMLLPGGYSEWLRVDNGVEAVSTDYNTTAQADALVAWWAAHKPDRKFAYVALHAAHLPKHQPPPALTPGFEYSAPLTDRSLFEAMLIAADTEIGRMLEEVDLDTTLVVVTSDNGSPAFGNGQKGSVLSGGTNVPLVWVEPGGDHGIFDGTLVQLVDLLPEFASLLGTEPPPALDGVQFGLRDHLFAETFKPNGFGQTHTEFRRVVGLDFESGFFKLTSIDGALGLWKGYVETAVQPEDFPREYDELLAKLNAFAVP